jgi:hypothetical protein
MEGVESNLQKFYIDLLNSLSLNFLHGYRKREDEESLSSIANRYFSILHPYKR